MPARRLSAEDSSNLVWLCRQLASALRRNQPILSALDALRREVPASLKGPVAAMRERASVGDSIGRSLAEAGLPSFVSGTLISGELQGGLDRALSDLADTLEAGDAAETCPSRRLRTYALAFQRLGLMLRVGVPVLTAIESAAESVPGTQARDVFMAVRDAVREGADLSHALDRVAPDLPPMTTVMVADGEREGRLGYALPIVADYLLDQAGERPARARKQEVQDA